MVDTKGGLHMIHIQYYEHLHAFGFLTTTMQEEGMQNNKMTIAGDEISSIMAHNVLWLYTISCNHKVWKWY